MCRLFGFIGNVNEEIIRILRGLILSEEASNPHGTGILVADKRGFKIQKKGLRGLHYIAQGFADFLWNEKGHKIIMGHVRYKTTGEQSDRNAHPFGSQANNTWYWLAHNGVLGGKMKEIAQQFGANKLSDAKVDSELFLRSITALLRQGVSLEDAIEKVTYEVSSDGDFAFTLLSPDGLYLWRNDARPLNLIFYRNSIFYASTLEMFKKASHIAGLKTEKIQYHEVQVFKLYKITFKGKEKKVCYEVVRELKSKPKKTKKKISGSYADWVWDGTYWRQIPNNKHNKQYSIISNNSKYRHLLELNVEELTTRQLQSVMERLTDLYYNERTIPEEDRIEIESKLVELEYELSFRERFFGSDNSDNEDNGGVKNGIRDEEPF
ncbi:class II glutamine amidotransferase [Thermodesulfovibrio sp. TK110]